MPAIPYDWKNVGVGVWETANRDGTNLLRVAVDSSAVPGLHSGGWGEVAADALSESTRRVTGWEGGYPPPPPSSRPG